MLILLKIDCAYKMPATEIWLEVAKRRVVGKLLVQ